MQPPVQSMGLIYCRSAMLSHVVTVVHTGKRRSLMSMATTSPTCMRRGGQSEASSTWLRGRATAPGTTSVGQREGCVAERSKITKFHSVRATVEVCSSSRFTFFATGPSGAWHLASCKSVSQSGRSSSRHPSAVLHRDRSLADGMGQKVSSRSWSAHHRAGGWCL
jgi:hypothetical protein